MNDCISETLSTKTSGAPEDATSARRVAPLQWVLIGLIFTLGLTIRFIGIDRMSLFLDESWVVELAMGNGQIHEELESRTLYTNIPPPTRLEFAAPAFHIFTSIKGITHPPGYIFLLRLWCNLFGTGDVSTRALSAVASMLATLVLFDVARRLLGTPAALWSAMIMTLAGPQFELAQEVRPYMLQSLFCLICADLILMMNGTSRSALRWMLAPVLVLTIIISMLMHYFALGAMLGLGIYSLFCLRGRARWIVVGSFIVAAIVFSVTWLPFMLEQRQTIVQTADNWLKEDSDGHVLLTLRRFCDIPFRMLLPQEVKAGEFKKIGVVLIIVPFFLVRRRRELGFLCCWLVGTLGLLTGLDLIRCTRHLELARYMSVAAPAVYMLPPALVLHFRSRLIRVMVPLVVVVSCVCALPAVRDLAKNEYREGAAYIDGMIQPGDVVVFLTYSREENYAGINWLSIAHYSKTYPWPFMLVKGRWDDAFARQLKDAPGACVVAPPGGYPPEEFVRGWKMEHLRYFHHYAEIYRLSPLPPEE